MRKQRDGAGTKETVIAAAKAAFAERGFSGTSLAYISRQCGISEGLILHHYKSKQGLYQAVLEELSVGYDDMLVQAMTGAENPDEMAGNMLAATFRFWSEDRVYNRIAMWAYLENRTELIAAETALTAKLAGLLTEMQKQGRVDAAFSPLTLLTMTIGPIHFWTRYREQFKRALGLEGTMDELNRRFLQEYMSLIEKLYRPGTGSAGETS